MATIYIKTQGIYDALYNFKDDTVGGNPTDWSTYEAQGTIQVIDNHNGHKRVIELHDTVNSGATNPLLCSNNFDGSQGNGTIELYLETDDVTKYTLIRVQTVCFDIYIDNSKWQYNAVGNIPAFDGVCDPVNDTVYYLKIHFRANGGAYQGLNNYEFKVILDGTFDSGALAFANNNVPNALLLASGQTDSDYYSWWDAIDYSWASGYSEGRNLLLEDHTDITSDVTNFKITTELEKIPKAMCRIKGHTFEEDDMIRVTDNGTSWENGKGMYKDSLNFRDDTIGSAPAQTGQGTWTDNDGADCISIIIPHFYKHRYVLELYDNGAGACVMDFALTDDTITDGSIEFWVASTDPTYEFFFAGYDEAANLSIGIKMDADLWYFYDNNGSWQAMGGTAPVICKWYRCTITFDCSDDSLSYTIVDEDGGAIASASSKTMNGTPDYIEDLKFTTQAADSGYIVFVDAIGFTWDTSYTLGDNADYEVTLASQTIFEGQITKQSREAIQKFNLLSVTEELSRGVGEENNAVIVEKDLTAEMISDLMGSYNHATATEQTKIYRATYTNLNYTDEATPFCFIDSSSGNCDITMELDSLDQHASHIDIFDNDAVEQCEIYHYFGSQGYGTIEFWIRYSDRTQIFNCMFKSGASRCFLYGPNTNQHSYYNGAWTNVVAAADAHWYRIRIDYESTTGEYLGLAQYDFNIYIYDEDGITLLGSATDVNFENNLDPTHIHIQTSGAGNNYHIYLDSIGYTWDWRYNECIDYAAGDNEQILVDYIEPSAYAAPTQDVLFEGDLKATKFLTDMAHKELMMWYLLIGNEIVMNDLTNDSQIDFSSSDKIWAVKGSDRIQRINKVVVKGGITGGHRVYATANNTDSQTTYGVKLAIFFATEIIDFTELQRIADNILEKHENAPDQVILWRDCSTEGMMQVGETVTISASDIEYAKNTDYVAAGEWIIRKIVYYPLTNAARFYLIDSVLYSYKKEDIEYVEKLVNTTL